MAEEKEAEITTATKKAPAKKAPAKKAPAKSKTRARNESGHFVPDDPSTPDVNEAYVQETVEPTIVTPATKRVRVKGTWRMSFCGQPYDFVDGEYFDLPPDLYNYLRAHGNIYDTLA